MFLPYLCILRYIFSPLMCQFRETEILSKKLKRDQSSVISPSPLLKCGKLNMSLSKIFGISGQIFTELHDNLIFSKNVNMTLNYMTKIIILT